jgi:hypothetical protein
MRWGCIRAAVGGTVPTADASGRLTRSIPGRTQVPGRSGMDPRANLAGHSPGWEECSAYWGRRSSAGTWPGGRTATAGH